MATVAKTAYRRDKILTKRQMYERTRSALYSDRSTFDAHWRELANFIRPRRARFQVQDRNRGDRRNQNIIDATATLASRTLRSGMHAGITSPARPWMRLSTPDPDLAEFGPVKEWLHTVTQRMLTVFSNSNLYQALPIVYGDMGDFGTAAMCLLSDPADVIFAETYPIGSYWLGSSARGKIDTCIREYTMTVRQIIEEFALDRETMTIDWSNISQTIKNIWDRGESEQVVEVCWIVGPNRDADPTKLDAKYLPWSSCHFEKGSSDDTYLRESGFHEFPILAPRWEVTGEDTYGTDCPGMTALGDVKALQIEQKRKAQGIEKKVNPPLTAPTFLQNRKISGIPGDVTYVDVREGQQGVKPIYESNIIIKELVEDIREVQYTINRAYFADLFLMLAQTDRRQITAREIDERHEEKLLALGPVLEQTNFDLLDPAVDLTYGLMDRAGMIPDPPDELVNVKLKVEYESLLHQAQRQVGAAGLDRLMATVIPLSQLFPEIKHKIDIFQVVDDMGNMLGVNPKIIVPDDQATEALQAERQAQAAAAQAQTMQTLAQSAQHLGNASLEGDNALKRVMEGAANA